MSIESETRVLAENLLLRQQNEELRNRLNGTNQQLKALTKELTVVVEGLTKANDLKAKS